MGGEQSIAFRQLQVADQRVLEFADDGVGLVVPEIRPEAQLPVLRPYLQLKLEGFAAEAVVINPYGIGVLGDHGPAVGRPDFDLLAPGGVVVKPPQAFAAGVVVAGRAVGQKRQASVCIINAEAYAVGNHGGLRKKHFLRALPFLPAAARKEEQRQS